MVSFKGINVLVTGGSGFIGSTFCRTLVSKGANVTAYDNLSSGNYEFIKDLVDKKKLKFVKGDVLDKDLLSSTMKADSIGLVAHFSANADVSKGNKNTFLDLEQGAIATYNVLESARKNDVKYFMFPSSSAVYGIADKKPTPEDYGPLQPISLYAASKLASEGLITSFSHLFGIKYYIYRFANIVGPNTTHGVIFDFVRKLKSNPNELEVLGDGKQRKSYMDVDDCVNAMLFICEKTGSRDNLYNLATDDQIEVSEIAKMVVSKVAKDAMIKYTGGIQGWPGDVPNSYLSNARMKALGFVPRFGTSREAVSNAIDAFVGKNKHSPAK